MTTMTRRVLVLLAIAACMGTARADAPLLTPPEQVGLDAAKLAEIRPFLQKAVDNGEAAGVVTLIARKGKLAHIEAVGYADIATKRPMSADTLFWIASMSKPIGSAALLICMDDGKLAIDDPVSKYIPEFADVKFKDGFAPKSPITIRHLLTHTSGIGNPAPDQFQHTMSLAEQAIAMAKAPLQFEPGSQWRYGGLTNITVAGRVVEVVSGQSFDAFLAERLLEPLGMKDTGFLPTAEQRKRLASIYKPGKQKGTLERTTVPWINDSPDAPPIPGHPSGGLFSTAADIAAFYNMLLAGGTANGQHILAKSTVELMTTIHTADLKAGFVGGSGWGLGVGIVKEPTGVTAALSVGSFGHGGAFGTQSWADPKTQMVYVLLVARTGFGNSDGADLRAGLQKLAAAAIKD